MKTFYFILIAIYLLSFQIFCKEYVLYKGSNDGLQTQYIDDFKENILKPGDIFITPNKKFYIEKILGHGNTTLIFQVKLNLEDTQSYALRLPYFQKHFTLKNGMTYIDSFHTGYKILQEHELPIPHIYDYAPNSYLLVDIIEYDYELDLFLARPDLFAEKDYLAAKIALLNFFKSSAEFSSISDFHSGQLVYSKENNRWTILDWLSQHEIATDKTSMIIISESILIFLMNLAQKSYNLI